MSKKAIIIILSVLGAIVLQFLIPVIFILISLSTDKCKPELLQSVPSPNGKYTIKTYLDGCGGATVDYSVIAYRCDKNDKCKKIYFCYHENDSLVYWLDNENIFINNKKMNVFKDKYNSYKDDNSYEKEYKLYSYGELKGNIIYNDKKVTIEDGDTYKIKDIIEKLTFEDSDNLNNFDYHITIIDKKDNQIRYDFKIEDNKTYIRQDNKVIELDRTDTEYFKRIIEKYKLS